MRHNCRRCEMNACVCASANFPPRVLRCPGVETKYGQSVWWHLTAHLWGGMTQRKVFVCFILGYASILCALELCERARDKRKPCAYLLTHLAELSRLRKATNDDGHIDGTHNMRDTRRNRKGNSLSFIWRAKYIVGGHEAQFERNIGSYFMTMARTMVGILTVTNKILRSTALRCVCQCFGSEQRTSSDVPPRKNKLWPLNRFAVCVHKVYAHVHTLSRTTTLINAHTREFSPSSSAYRALSLTAGQTAKHAPNPCTIH